MRKRSDIGCLIVLVLLVLSVVPANSANESNTNVASRLENQSMPSDTPDLSELNLSWTSRWESTPQQFGNNSELVGDHVVLNATWNDQISGGNVTSTTLKITDGFTFNTTRPLQPGGPTGTFELPVEWTDWIEIPGMIIGKWVNITGYAENDCDYFAFDGSTPIEDYEIGTNLLGHQMYTVNNPEHGSFIWNSDSDTLVLGCHNYDDAVGNYSVYIEVGEMRINSVSGNSIVLDTYHLSNRNDTYQIDMIAETDLNDTFSLRYEDITICNFFAPEVVVPVPVPTIADPNTFNMTWSSTDLNADDTTYYSLWLSNNDGVSYMILAWNLTVTSYMFNSTGWLEGFYMIRVRAYSVDTTSIDCALDNPPNSYWPGDFSDGFSASIDFDNHPPPPHYNVNVNIETHFSYSIGSTGNTITVYLSADHTLPTSISYSVADDGIPWLQGDYEPISTEDSFDINIDGLSVGYHVLTIVVSDFIRSYYKTCYVNVTVLDTGSNPFDSTPFIQALGMGISAGSIAIIVLVVFLTLRLKRNKVVEYVGPE